MPTSDDLQHSISTRQLTMIGIGKAIGVRLLVGGGKEIPQRGRTSPLPTPSDLVTILVTHMLAGLSTAAERTVAAHTAPSEQSATVWAHPHLIGDADGISYAVQARAMELRTWR
ncbi:hypothetical protein [Nocardia sp. NPDC005998]|uniref:hypothetical protein n=1 Tax=Nocardia sp. NPDC005998 TaxID=3156894 RepID=UPI00339F138A